MREKLTIGCLVCRTLRCQESLPRPRTHLRLLSCSHCACEGCKGEKLEGHFDNKEKNRQVQCKCTGASEVRSQITDQSETLI